ncbi:MAG: prolyl oligopeptidase family serine peptidase [Lentisphaerae bacterium]|jgi:dienelactone hydrolase|nr:prolyl oligopeptidase family serine peptidase [Lentisphaerota bacterium]MBT4816973.1 prolyl oligopeptidase family serine peptidase [Lentisphaerota bacterium]MBT5611745.1 prolyl oligopeptidase family serine peptidase [Lentisphaerota bacterium]MBT7054147.1 prolyl oligopeptidase family serine peptidase [Lentisphaerota bacterium]MBT7848418.1 prolyl oligopeptidase family serine peptidase [Lentisphaerota bacterium]
MNTLWDVQALLDSPRIHPAPGHHADGMQALFYDGLPWKGGPTRVFAWLGLPPGLAPGETCPGIVLVHGGGGTAFDYWVRLWNSRGYAAIAMDLCGCIPEPPPTPPGQPRTRHAAGGPPGWGASYEQIDDPVEDQWTYHAVADIALAYSLLAARPEVDQSRIGITGISWGGYLTSIVSGVDDRFRFAVPVYGCGFYQDCPAFRVGLEPLGPERMQRWLGLWDPSVYLPRAKMPVLWVTGTNDGAYPLDALQSSYQLVAGYLTLCIRIEMPHGHGGLGENPEEIHVFADSFLKDGVPLARIIRQDLNGNTLRVEFEAEGPVVRAELIYTRAHGFWQDRKWNTAPAELNVEEGWAESQLPAETTVCYMNLIDDRDCVVSSRHMEL